MTSCENQQYPASSGFSRPETTARRVSRKRKFSEVTLSEGPRKNWTLGEENMAKLNGEVAENV